MSMWNKILLCIMIIGGLNWGLVGLFNFNLVGWIFGGALSIWSRIIYVVVGVASLCSILMLCIPETRGGSQ